MKVVGNLKGLIGEIAADYIGTNSESFRSNVPGPAGAVGVHHLKGTSTTQNEGDFAYPGETDTYTFYPDANETYSLGWFNVRNGQDAYNYAVTAGYAGTEADFYLELANIREYFEQSEVNATSALSSATTATTKANEASVSATSAATYATNANTSASSAASSATDANTSKLSAISSADAASASAVSANQSALDAIEALDEFTDIYLGRKATAPTVDNDGNALVEGTIYWNTTSKSLFIHDGTNWNTAVFDASGAVVSFNGRDGEVTLTNSDVTEATGQDLSVVGTPSFASVKVTGGTGLTAGVMSWNADESTVDLVLENGATLQVGQENNRLVRNDTGVTITNMTVCMFAGTIGNSGRVKVAPFDGIFTHTHYIYGIATHNIGTETDGYITINGKVREVDTTGSLVGETWIDGDILYAKPNDNGRLTNVEPADDELKIIVASVVKAHTSGTLEVRVLPFNENMIAKRANKLTTTRTISLSGDVSGSVNFDGSENANMTVTVADDSHLHSFSNITNKPTTISGYGIIDAYTKTEIDTITNNLDALPSQTGFAGKYLKTDGKVATWESASTGTGLSTFDFVATAGQTAFSIVYVPGNIDVHHNGLLLSKGDYVATNGTSVILNTGAAVSDVISITVYDTFDVANTYTKGEIDLVIGNINTALDIINGEVI